MLLYAYFIPKVDFKRKFNHHQSFLYEWRLTARTIRKFRIGPSVRIESWIGRTIRNQIESRSFAGPYISPLLFHKPTTRLRFVDRSVGIRCTAFNHLHFLFYWMKFNTWLTASTTGVHKYRQLATVRHGLQLTNEQIRRNSSVQNNSMVL